MNKYFLFVIIITVFFSFKQDKTYEYCKTNRFEIENAKDYYNRIKSKLINKSKEYNTNYKLISAIVFPELIRYSLYRDFFETTVLEYFYVQNGSKSANFSIGLFQIKPSFVEQLEKYVIKYNLNKYLQITKFNSIILQEIRAERINRIKSIDWQIIYINCFYDLIETKFKPLNFVSKQEQLKFYATAYNHGFNCSKNEILNWEKINAFPNGINSKEKKYNYADISVCFYNNQYNK